VAAAIAGDVCAAGPPAGTCEKLVTSISSLSLVRYRRLAVFARVEPALRKSITFDNDTAFAQHALVRTMRAMSTP
jgi:hypothetical protein